MVLVFVIGLSPIIHSQGGQPPKLSQAEFDRLFDQVSNWGRWGKDDQRGATNLITDEKRRQVAALVRSGISVSMQYSPLEPSAPERGDPFYSHLEALCHVNYKGRTYNGFAAEQGVNPRCSGYREGVGALGLDVLKSGILTRGVLIDIPTLTGLPWLEPGTPVTLQDVTEWETKTGIKVLPGDAVFLRTGRWARRARGAIRRASGQEPAREAGFHWSVVPWFKSRDVAFFGSDTSLDVRPPAVEQGVSGVDGPVRILALVAMGVHVFDGQDLEGVAQVANTLKRWEFLITAAPNTITGGTGAPINIIATF